MILKRYHLLLLLVFAFFVNGCGGGGSAATALQYFTDWTNRSVPGRVSGLSQRVSILGINGNVVSTQIINQGVDSLQSFTFPAVPAGTYRLKIELFSLANLGGTQTGIIETVVTLNGSTTFATGVGDAISAVKVVPLSATFKVQSSQQFYAYAVNATNRATFITPGDISWSTLGGVASINSEGIATGTIEGVGSVRATHVPSGLLGAASITVNPLNITTTKWTVLVYLNAANDLSLFDEANVNQMEAAASNPDVRFVLQWKQAAGSWDNNPSFQGTRRYLVKPDSTSAIASELITDMGNNVDMGQASTLLDFLNWGRTYYPADRYCVVIWNHGNGWRRGVQDLITRGVSYDDQTGNSIQTWQLSQALGSSKWDIVAWDASLMQMMEVAYEIKDQANFVVGSEESPPGEGFPYDSIFARFRDNPTDTTKNLTKAFVDGMTGDPRYTGRKITQSVVDTSKLGALATALGSLSDALIANKSSLTSTVPNVRAAAQSYSPTTSRVYRDIVDLCLRLEATSGIPGDVFTASQGVRLAVGDAVVWEGHNAQSANSHGLSIDFSSSTTFPTSSADYARMSFANQTSWNEWLQVAP